MSTTANLFSGSAEDIVESITHEIYLLSLICEKLNGVVYPDNVMENVCLNHAMSLIGNCVQSVTMYSIRSNRLLRNKLSMFISEDPTVKYALCSSMKFSNMNSSLLSSLDEGRCSQVADVMCCGVRATQFVHDFKNSVGSRGGSDLDNANTEVNFYDEMKSLIVNICMVREFGDTKCDLNKLQELLHTAVLDPLLFFVISIVAVFWYLLRS